MRANGTTTTTPQPHIQPSLQAPFSSWIHRARSSSGVEVKQSKQENPQVTDGKTECVKMCECVYVEERHEHEQPRRKHTQRQAQEQVMWTVLIEGGRGISTQKKNNRPREEEGGKNYINHCQNFSKAFLGGSSSYESASISAIPETKSISWGLTCGER